jgi:hypothetical protein
LAGVTLAESKNHVAFWPVVAIEVDDPVPADEEERR